MKAPANASDRIGIAETPHEIIFRNNLDAEQFGLLVFPRSRLHIVVDEETRGPAHTARHLAAFRLDVGFQFVAILEMVHIAGDDECKARTLVSLWGFRHLRHTNLAQQMVDELLVSL